ncbi:hypothetical protein E3N88_13895 [Mikania micrantha]|uniref:Uncharacterized protein n=1 Tax=Mikania micrantha TaxID=192012 RepID=A0A5N6P2Z0_9ASTR|nr:hypothetical protein E3N88_13895 [Mikania micrantha]
MLQLEIIAPSGPFVSICIRIPIHGKDQMLTIPYNIELWKKSLNQVADLKGKDAKGRKESELIEEVVIDIQRRLRNAMPHLIGVDYEIKLIRSRLKIGSHHRAEIITVSGASGIGKTSLAKYVFQLHSSQFHKVSFIEGINERCDEKCDGLLDLQKQLLEDISNKILLHATDALEYTSKIENVLASKKVLIALDNIGSIKQLDALLGNKGLHSRAKIIITTKDASLTKRCALFKIKVKPKHKKVILHGLNESESLELLCIHAFKNDKPKEGYKEVSVKLVKYCEGNPLALKILGRSLQQKDIRHWEECIKMLKKEPHSHINKALKISFDAFLFENDKELFKHIACFFVGNDRDVTEIILNACDIETRSGIKILIDRGLLSVTGDNRLMMHQSVQEMGRDLVRQESPKKPWKRSRSFCHEESCNVLKQKKARMYVDKGSLLGLALDTRMLDKKKSCGSFELNTKSFNQMDNLVLLQLNYVRLNGPFENLPEELRWLCMHGSPLESIHLDLPMDNLVVLDMSYSNMEFFNPQPPAKSQKQLVGSCSKDKPLLGSLKILDLSFCDHLLSLGGFLELPALERLIVRGCRSLIELSESVGHCVELVLIDLSYCHMLRMLPKSIGKLKKVKTLLDGCYIDESQIKTGNMNSSDSLLTLPLKGNYLSNESFASFSLLTGGTVNSLNSCRFIEELYGQH